MSHATSFDCGWSAAAERGHQAGLVGEVAGSLLRMDQPAVNRDLEHSAARGNQLDIGGDRPLNCGRQTGGPFAIASLVAVFNRDLHGHLPAAGNRGFSLLYAKAAAAP